MATQDDISTSQDKIAGHRIPNWNGTQPEDLEAILNDNMNKPQHVIEVEPDVPGRCQRCRNPKVRCICLG